MERKKVLVVGSANMDTTQIVKELPTTLNPKGVAEGGTPPKMVLGGKGFNQARAIKLQNPDAEVSFISCIGNDAAGRAVLREMDMVGSFVERDENGNIKRDENDNPIVDYMPGFTPENVGIEHSGVIQINASTDGQTIFVDKTGKNEMIGHGNCVTEILPAIINLELLEAADIIVAQMKMPNYETVEDEQGNVHIVGDGAIKFLAEYCSQHGKTFVVDPTPTKNSWILVKENLLDKIDYIKPNEKEAFALIGYLEGKSLAEIEAEYKKISRKELLQKIEQLVEQHHNIIATVGEDGVIYHDGKKVRQQPTYKLPTKAVDSTGAGDTFNGGFVGALTRGEDLKTAIKFGLMASRMKVRYQGAQVGVPTYEETREAIIAYEKEHTREIDDDE